LGGESGEIKETKMAQGIKVGRSMEQKIWKRVGDNVVLAESKEGRREGRMEMPLIRGKLSIKVNPKTILQKSKEGKGF
jgi:hypothetical protein